MTETSPPPCPFCGSPATTAYDRHGFWVSCRALSCVAPAVVASTPEEALRRWSQRAALEAPDVVAAVGAERARIVEAIANELAARFGVAISSVRDDVEAAVGAVV